MSAEARFLELLPTIDGIAAVLARRRGLLGADGEDFCAHVRARFVESSYAPLAQFRGDASVRTYLTVVIASWLKDYIVARDGRWRPSAAALRAGPIAVQLERLLTKGRRTADAAIAEVLAGGDHSYSERELRAIVHSLPMREPMRPRVVASDDAAEVPSSAATQADARVEAGEHDLAVARARQTLDAVMATLNAEDRLVVSMRFLDGQSVADIARALRVEQKPLYRRLERSLTTLRRGLEASGVTGDTVRDLVTGGG